MAIPEKPKKVLQVLYQQYIQTGYSQQRIPYDSFDCPKSELTGPLDDLVKLGFIESYAKRKDGLLYSLSEKGITYHDSPDAPYIPDSREISISFGSLDLSDLHKDMLNDFLSDINNSSISAKDKKARLRGHILTLSSALSAETFADILSDLLCCK